MGVLSVWVGHLILFNLSITDTLRYKNVDVNIFIEYSNRKPKKKSRKLYVCMYVEEGKMPVTQHAQFDESR